VWCVISHIDVDGMFVRTQTNADKASHKSSPVLYASETVGCRRRDSDSLASTESTPGDAVTPVATTAAVLRSAFTPVIGSNSSGTAVGDEITKVSRLRYFTCVFFY